MLPRGTPATPLPVRGLVFCFEWPPGFLAAATAYQLRDALGPALGAGRQQSIHVVADHRASGVSLAVSKVVRWSAARRASRASVAQVPLASLASFLVSLASITRRLLGSSSESSLWFDGRWFVRTALLSSGCLSVALAVSWASGSC